MMQFKRILGIDFETAAAQRATACSMGLCLMDFATGEVLEKLHCYINPECDFDAMNISVHGIEPADVSDAPTFPTVLDEFVSRLDESTIVCAHNAPFDVSVLLRSCMRYSIVPPEFVYYDTLWMSKSVLPNIPDHTLDAVAEHLCLPPFAHHRADDDAEACASILYELTSANGLTTDRAIKKATGKSPRNSLDALKEIHKYDRDRKPDVPCSHSYPASSVAHKTPRLVLDKSPVSEQALAASPFFGRRVVITGNLSCCTRDQAKGYVEYAGGVVRPSVTSRTHILVCGDGYVSGSDFPAVTGKIASALSLIDSGNQIAIIDEAEFVAMFATFIAAKEQFPA